MAPNETGAKTCEGGKPHALRAICSSRASRPMAFQGSSVVSVTRARVSVVGQPWHWRSGLGFADAELWYPAARSMSRRLRGRPLPALMLSLQHAIHLHRVLHRWFEGRHGGVLAGPTACNRHMWLLAVAEVSHCCDDRAGAYRCRGFRQQSRPGRVLTACSTRLRPSCTARWCGGRRRGLVPWFSAAVPARSCCLQAVHSRPAPAPAGLRSRQ